MITIGIPVYNCPKELISQCLNSVLNQTINDIEILIINDCCTDDTMDYILHYIKGRSNEKKIRIINHKINTGIGGARNTIIQEAKGEYIFFIDCDDFITIDAIEKLYNKAKEYNADSVWGSVMGHTISNNSERIFSQNPDMHFLAQDELATYAFSDSHVHLPNAVWNILIKIDFIKKNNLQFETECGSCDDYVFTFKMIPLVKNAVLLKDITYYWVIREGSQSNPIETVISSKPLRKAIVANNVLKNYSQSLKQKPYYEGYCLRVSKESFFNAHAIVKLRSKLDYPILNREIKESISPIESFLNICKFKKHRKKNLVFYCLAKLPSFIIPFILRFLYDVRKTL